MRKRSLKISLISVAVLAVVVAITLLSVYFATSKKMSEYVECQVVKLDGRYKTTVDKRFGKYLGHPDLVEIDGTLMTFYPSGPGKGAIIGKVSNDLGQSWQNMTNLPKSWANSMETPCVYKLTRTDGSQVLVLTSGCPNWAADGILPDGFNSSLSFDGGKTWSEFDHLYGKEWALSEFGDSNKAYDGVVAMSSLTQLKYKDGRFIDKWMATFHRGAHDKGMDAGNGYTNYRTYLTIESDKAVWSRPEPIFTEQQHILEDKYGMCELEIIRNEKDDCLIMLARPNRRVSNALICYSYDEGETWSDPRQLPNCLTGDRHKAEYDSVSGKLIISFRQLLQDGDKYKTNAFAADSVMSEGWVAWVGDFDDLMSYADGDSANDTYGDGLIVLGKNYKGADCGYSGVVILGDGTAILHSYGYFDAGATKPYIMQTKFKINDVIKSK